MSSLPAALRRATAVVPAAALALTLAACGDSEDDTASDAASGEAIVLEHAQGETELDGVPEKVYVYDFATLSVLDELGVEVAGIPKEGAPEQFQSYVDDENVEDIGTLFEPDYELVAEEQPDLVLIGGRSSATYPELSEIAPTADMSNDSTQNYESSLENTEKLGALFDKQDQADQMIADLETAVQETKQSAGDAGTGLVVLTTGGKVSAYGPGGRFGFPYDELGIEPAAEVKEEEQHGQSISFEFLRETDPEWLFVIDRDAAIGEGSESAEQVFDNDIVKQTSAYKNDRIVYVDPGDWYILGGGVPALTNITEDVRSALQG